MAHRIWIRSYHRDGEWVDGYWRKIDDVAKAVKKLNTTDRAAVQLPDGVEITKASQTRGGGYIITGGQEGSAPEHVNTYNAHEAARTALQRSARSTHPRSLGGARSFQTHVQAAKADRAKARRETKTTTKPRRRGAEPKKKTFTVEFRGETYTRKSEADYGWASYRPFSGNLKARSGVRWHTTEAAARRSAGPYGEVKRAEIQGREQPTQSFTVHLVPREGAFAVEPMSIQVQGRDQKDAESRALDEFGEDYQIRPKAEPPSPPRDPQSVLTEQMLKLHEGESITLPNGTQVKKRSLRSKLSFDINSKAVPQNVVGKFQSYPREVARMAQSRDQAVRKTSTPVPKPTPPRGKPTPDPDPPPTPPGGTTQDDLAKAKRKFRKLRRETTKLEDTLNRHALTAGQQATLEKKLTLKRSQLETQERIVKNLEETGGKPEPRNEPGGRKRHMAPEPKASTSSFTMLKADADALLSQVDQRGFRPDNDDDQARAWDSVKSKLQLATGKPGDKVKLKLTNDENRALVLMAEHGEDYYRNQVNKDPRADNVNSHLRNMNALSDVKKRARRKVPRAGGGKFDALVRTDFRPDKQSNVREQLNQLLNVHSLPTGVHRIDIGRLDPREYPTYNGVYLGGFGSSGRIQLRENAGPLTLWHEVGHYLDYQKMKQQFSYKPASESVRGETIAKSMKKLMDTIEETAGIQRIRRQSYGPSGRGRPSKHQRYLLQKREQFARAYAQYIATKTQNAHALQEIERRSHSMYSADHWKRDDFQPVVEAFDKLMKELGWIQYQ